MEEELEKKKEPVQGQEQAGTVETVETEWLAIVEQIRSDSLTGRLTGTTKIKAIAADPEKLKAFLAIATTDARYSDIKLLLAAHGERYLYSEKGFTKRQAEIFAFGEEVRVQIAFRVREDSKERVKLTPVNNLSALIPGAEPDKVDLHLNVLMDNAENRDIHLVSNSKGDRFLYSENFMTSQYAEILARTETKDPYDIIAQTVRDESRTYPRPTNVELFQAPVFKIDPDRLGSYIEGILTRPEFKDITALTHPSTGARYLYSRLYLNADLAESQVEWLEVGSHDNP